VLPVFVASASISSLRFIYSFLWVWLKAMWIVADIGLCGKWGDDARSRTANVLSG